jgi:hypothetical protein
MRDTKGLIFVGGRNLFLRQMGYVCTSAPRYKGHRSTGVAEVGHLKQLVSYMAGEV